MNSVDVEERKDIMSVKTGLRTVLGTVLAMLMVVSAACGQAKQDEGPDYADDEAMSVIANGYEKRSDEISRQEAAGEDTKTSANLKKAIQTEIDADKDLKSRQFKDSKMQETVISYLNSLDDQLDVVKTHSMNDLDFYEAWNKVYDQRSILLKTMVDKYGLKVGDKYKDDFEDLLANGTSATKQSEADETIKSLVENATFEKTSDGYGNFTYTAVIENTSKLTFTNVSLTLDLIDAQGVKQEAYANANSWALGEKVKFEAFSNVDAASVKPHVQYYDTGE